MTDRGKAGKIRNEKVVSSNGGALRCGSREADRALEALFIR